MRKLRRLKPYKACDPLETVERVRAILDGLGIEVVESHTDEPDLGLYSCRIQMVLPEGGRILPGIGSNGKGMTRAYSLASAYAEFMERVQNGFLLNNHASLALRDRWSGRREDEAFRTRLEEEELFLDFAFAPDEHHIAYDEMLAFQPDIVRGVLGDAAQDNGASMLSRQMGEGVIPVVPFYHTASRSIRDLPISLLQEATYSTGMCAGNTKEEALIQGITEIFERHALMRIYREEPVLPTVPVAPFEGTAGEATIRRIEDEGCRTVTIKDCSFGVGLPVLGALLVDHDLGKYTFRLGADPSPVTALERCLTEMYQGSVKEKLHEIPESGFSFRDASDKTFHQMSSWRSGTGRWPESILVDRGTDGFRGFDHPVSRSDREDLRYICRLIEAWERDLYIRDVSYLGFPAFYAYIPGMSEKEWSTLRGPFEARVGLMRSVGTLLNVHRAGTERIRKMAEAVEDYRAHVPYPSFHHGGWLLYRSEGAVLDDLDIDLFLASLWLRCGETGRAAAYVDRFLQKMGGNHVDVDPYWRCLADFLSHRLGGEPARNRDSWVDRYGADLAKAVEQDLESPERLLERLCFPTCFECDRCGMRSQCRFVDLLSYRKRLQERQKTAAIDQRNLQEILR